MKVKQVLMCRPSYFRVEYVINPWMKVGSVDAGRAMRQWERLKAVYLERGIRVSIIEQREDCPDMVFAADQALLLEEKKVLLSRFRYPERQQETNYYLSWFKRHGFDIWCSCLKMSFLRGMGIVFIGEMMFM